MNIENVAGDSLRLEGLKEQVKNWSIEGGGLLLVPLVVCTRDGLTYERHMLM
jgi:hypothetical protein